MPINIPDSFESLGRAINNGGSGDEPVEEVIGLDGIKVTTGGGEVRIAQPLLTYKESTALSYAVAGATAGSTGQDVIRFYDWSSTEMIGQSGLVQYWNGTTSEWLQADSSSFNATLLLGISVGAKDCVKRGLVRTTRDFSTFTIGQSLYLGTNGEVSTAIPTTQNHYERLLGWVMDQDATAGLMFFSPDVNFKTIA